MNARLLLDFLKKPEGRFFIALFLILVVLLLVGALPTWPHSRNWGYYPSSGLGVVLVVIVVLLLL